MKTDKGKKQNEKKGSKGNAKWKKKKKKCRGLNSNQVFLKAMDLQLPRDQPRRKKIKKKISETKPVQEPSKEIEDPLFTDLSHKEDMEGLVVLGCIKEIQELYLTVDLPGRISGIVPANNICTEYVSNLKQFLVDESEEYPIQNYRIGQLVLTRIGSVKSDKECDPVLSANDGKLNIRQMKNGEKLDPNGVKISKKKLNKKKKRECALKEKRTQYEKAKFRLRLQEELQQKESKQKTDESMLKSNIALSKLDFTQIPKIGFSVKPSMDKKEVELSMRPEDVNYELLSEDFKVGLMVSAAVHSIEENVYVMNCGVTDVRAYLSKDQSLKYETIYNNGRQLAIGQVILCVVTSHSIVSTSTDSIIVGLSLDPELMTKAYPTDAKIICVPGMIYNVTISEISEKGVIVQFSSGENAIVFHEYTDFLKEIQIGQQVLARILYVDHSKQNIYMTLLKNICCPGPELNFIIPGFSGKAKIVNVYNEIVTLQLGNNCFYGFAIIGECPFFKRKTKRIHFLKSKEKRTDLEKKEGEKSYFQKVKEECFEFMKQKVNRLVYYRTQYYDFMSEKFICQIRLGDGNKMSEFTSNGMTLGELKFCIIESRNDGYLTVLVEQNGHYDVRGIVNWIHYDDEVSKENIHLVESRLTLGSLKECKVISVIPVLELSLRLSLLNSRRRILFHSDQENCKEPYDGIVEEITSNFLKVKFFNNFACGVPRNKVQDGLKCSLEESYKVGQLVTCYIHDINHLTGDYDMEVRKTENKVKITQDNDLNPE